MTYFFSPNFLKYLTILKLDKPSIRIPDLASTRTEGRNPRSKGSKQPARMTVRVQRRRMG